MAISAVPASMNNILAVRSDSQGFSHKERQQVTAGAVGAVHDLVAAGCAYAVTPQFAVHLYVNNDVL